MSKLEKTISEPSLGGGGWWVGGGQWPLYRYGHYCQPAAQLGVLPGSAPSPGRRLTPSSSTTSDQ